jgi:hypothetical protein
MRRLAALALFFAAASLFGAPCAPTATRLCLNGGRFAAEVSWRDFQGNTGPGHPVSLTGDTGYFWFFSSTNVELVVKVLDGRGINSSFWVFYGALSNVEYSMTVTDTVTGTVKSYANPSGHLGSVADTSAFPAAGAAAGPAARTALTTRPPAVETAAPGAAAACAPTATSLCLNGGRFRAEVSWRDFVGNKGQGQAIALTSDTGYFWFFNSANVELVVKVLDGRALNKDFWVFYGALSTVEYQLKVTDTLSGRTTFYFNPANNLASVADTSALGDGAFVQAVHDTSRAVTERIPTSGGSLATTAADGSRFTLEIPAGAFLSDEDVTMTPVSSIGSLPLSGGLAAAVHLEPEGLLLYESATLTIEPAVAVPRSQAITFSYQGGGAEFFLHPPLPAAGPVRLPVLHLTGYGIGRGTQADLDAQALRLPTLTVDQVSQQLAVILLPPFRSGAFGSSAAPAGAHPQAARACDPRSLPYFQQKYLDLAADLANVQDCGLLRVRLPLFRQFIQYVTSMECTGELNTQVASVKEAILTGQTHCFLQAYTLCVQERDPNQVIEIERWARELRRDGHGEIADPSKEHSCLRFELQFDSTIEQHSDVFGDDQVQWKSKSHLATRDNPAIPIEFNDATGQYQGSGPLNYLSASFSGRAEQTCTITVAPKTGSTFVAKTLDIELDTSLGYVVPLPPRFRLHYNIGAPKESIRKVCGVPPSDDTVTLGFYEAAYDASHTDDLDFVFDPTNLTFGFSVDLDFVGLHSQYAGKLYDKPEFIPPGEGRESSERHLTETTAITLSHVPK